VAERVRTIKAAIDPQEETWRQAQRDRWQPTLPAPATTAAATAITIVEVRAGLRPPHQLTALSHHSLWRFWARLAEPARDTAIPIVPRVLAVTVREVAPGLVDANVVVGFGGRTHALALRLDGAPGFWQLVELDYPTRPVLIGPPSHDVLPPLTGGRRDTRLPHAPTRPSLPEATGRPPREDLHLPPAPDQSLGIELE
jgi:hypothetical protein